MPLKEEKVKLTDHIRSQFKYGVNTNVYSAIVRGFVEAALKDLLKKLQLYRNIKEDMKRSPLEGLFTFYSREATKTLSLLFKESNKNIKELIQAASSYVTEVYKTACKLFDIVFLINIRTLSKLIIHTKNPYMPLEIGLSWHPYLNLPYIPAASLKGCFRSYFELNNTRICNLSSNELFGDDNKKGILTFFDALPISFNKSLIEPDVLAPHYPEIEGIISENRVKPRPLVYPVISLNVNFYTIVAVDFSAYRNKIAHQNFIKEFKENLNKVLYLGLGARTSVGYGVVKVNVVNIGGVMIK
ncbi:MAG: type III-B CRISPR module RAMP protein Cmr6 [Candidatus Njordarchaeales archaeon]